MDKKDVIINFIISLSAAIAFEVLKRIIESMQGWPFNGLIIFIISMLFFTCLKLWFVLNKYKAIMNKINIHGNEYYDIFEDIVYYQIHKPRNIMQINKLKWDFNFTYNPEDNAFLDLHAEWEILFTATKKRINTVKIGIHGGERVSEESMNIKTYQGNENANYMFQREQNDCTFLNINLNSDVVKNSTGKITLKYNWKQFMINIQKDDYIYLFPYAVAISVKQFELITTHPYECKATVVVLQHKWSGEYDKIEISDTNNIKMKIEISQNEYSKKHRIVFNEIDVRNVYLVIFEKK